MTSPAQQSEERREVCKCGHADIHHPHIGCPHCSCERYRPSIPTETREPEIPDDLREMYEWYGELPIPAHKLIQRRLIERIARSETREKMLEDTLGKLLETHCCDRTIHGHNYGPLPAMQKVVLPETEGGR